MTGVSSETSPEPLPAPAAFSGGKPTVTKWSAERVHALATLRAMGAPSTEILIAVNKLPGLKISSVASVDTKYHELKRAGTLPAVTVEKPPAARPKYGKWTPARVECLRKMRADGKVDAEILAALNKLPGDEFGAYAIRDFLRQPKNAGKFPNFVELAERAAQERQRAELAAVGKASGERPLGPPPADVAAVQGDSRCRGGRFRGNDGKSGNDGVAKPAMTVADVIARREAGPRDAAPAPAVKTPVGAALKHQVSEARQPAEPVSVDYDQARGWAAQRGLVSGHEALDIDKVNAKRRALGLGIFVMRNKGARQAA